MTAPGPGPWGTNHATTRFGIASVGRNGRASPVPLPERRADGIASPERKLGTRPPGLNVKAQGPKAVEPLAPDEVLPPETGLCGRARTAQRRTHRQARYSSVSASGCPLAGPAPQSNSDVFKNLANPSGSFRPRREE